MKLSSPHKNLISVFAIILSLSTILYCLTLFNTNLYKIFIQNNKIIYSTTDKTITTLNTTTDKTVTNSNTTLDISTNVSDETAATSDTTIETNKIIGFIKNIYEDNDKVFLTIDEVQFFFGDNADIERANDGLEESIVPYYIRNLSTSTVDYVLSKDSITNLCQYIVTPDATNSAITVPVSADTFKNYVLSNLFNDERALLFWFDIKNNEIINVEMQYTP